MAVVRSLDIKRTPFRFFFRSPGALAYLGTEEICWLPGGPGGPGVFRIVE